MNDGRGTPRAIERSQLPDDYPTHLLTDEFCAALGRVVATYGFLEETLVRAIYALTSTQPAPSANPDEALNLWIEKLERALKASLGGLITGYESAYSAHPSAVVAGFDVLVRDLRAAADVRNVLCHGSWPSLNSAGAATPFFVNRDLLVFDTNVDRAFLEQTRMHVSELVCDVVDSVTQLGLPFPGHGASTDS